MTASTKITAASNTSTARVPRSSGGWSDNGTLDPRRQRRGVRAFYAHVSGNFVRHGAARGVDPPQTEGAAGAAPRRRAGQAAGASSGGGKLFGPEQAIDARAQAVDLPHANARAEAAPLGEPGARQLIVLLRMLVRDEDGRHARKQQFRRSCSPRR